jgi:hypothetical protein
MTADRYLRIILTLIAIELGWIAFNQAAAPVSAQATPTRVVVTGIELDADNRGFLPVGVLGQMQRPGGMTRTFLPLDTTIRNERVAVSVAQPVDVRPIGVIKIEADRPLKVENVGYTPAQRPGE